MKGNQDGSPKLVGSQKRISKLNQCLIQSLIESLPHDLLRIIANYADFKTVEASFSSGAPYDTHCVHAFWAHNSLWCFTARYMPFEILFTSEEQLEVKDGQSELRLLRYENTTENKPKDTEYIKDTEDTAMFGPEKWIWVEKWSRKIGVRKKMNTLTAFSLICPDLKTGEARTVLWVIGKELDLYLNLDVMEHGLYERDAKSLLADIPFLSSRAQCPSEVQVQSQAQAQAQAQTQPDPECQLFTGIWRAFIVFVTVRQYEVLVCLRNREGKAVSAYLMTLRKNAGRTAGRTIHLSNSHHHKMGIFGASRLVMTLVVELNFPDGAWAWVLFELSVYLEDVLNPKKCALLPDVVDLFVPDLPLKKATKPFRKALPPGAHKASEVLSVRVPVWFAAGKPQGEVAQALPWAS